MDASRRMLPGLKLFRSAGQLQWGLSALARCFGNRATGVYLAHYQEVTAMLLVNAVLTFSPFAPDETEPFTWSEGHHTSLQTVRNEATPRPHWFPPCGFGMTAT